MTRDVRRHERFWVGARLAGWTLILAALAWDLSVELREGKRGVGVVLHALQVVGTVLVAVGFERYVRWAKARMREEASRTPPRG